MSKIPYRKDLTISQNIAKVREHTGMTNQDIGRQVNIDGATFGSYASRGFKTTAGNETPVTQIVRKLAESFFIGGIPALASTQIVHNLFDLMGCDSCQYRSKSHQGCYKFSFTKEEINKGPYITTLEHGAFTMSRTKPCPHAKVTDDL